MRGKIIALEGIDQSGKRTQTRLLAEELERKGARVGTISFPIYRSPSGRQIQRFLAGKQEYPATALHMLYSLNRWENQELITNLTEKSDFVIADRYYPSNLAYGVSRGLCSRERQEVAIESRTDLPKISKEVGLEDG